MERTVDISTAIALTAFSFTAVGALATWWLSGKRNTWRIEAIETRLTAAELDIKEIKAAGTDHVSDLRVIAASLAQLREIMTENFTSMRSDFRQDIAELRQDIKNKQDK